MKAIPIEGKLKEEIDADEDYQKRYSKALREFVKKNFGGVEATSAVMCLSEPHFRCNPMNQMKDHMEGVRFGKHGGNDYYVFRKNNKKGKELGAAWKKEFEALGERPKNFQFILMPFLSHAGSYGWQIDTIKGKPYLVNVEGVDIPKFLEHYNLKEETI
jgi:hypothetical protein